MDLYSAWIGWDLLGPVLCGLAGALPLAWALAQWIDLVLTDQDESEDGSGSGPLQLPQADRSVESGVSDSANNLDERWRTREGEEVSSMGERTSADRTNLLIAGVGALGLVCCVGMVIWAPAAAPAQIPVILTIVTGVLAVLQRAKDTARMVEESRQTADHRAVVLLDTTENLKSEVSQVRTLVNGSAHELRSELVQLRSSLADARTKLAVERAEAHPSPPSPPPPPPPAS